MAIGSRLFATNAKQVSDEMMVMAVEALYELERATENLKSGINNREPGRGLPIIYCQTIMEKATGVCIEVSRANGAILVRGTD